MKHRLTIDPAATAALFIDLQEEHRLDKRLLVEDFDRVLRNVGLLQATARETGVPLIHFAYVVDTLVHNRRFHPLMPDGKSYFSDKNDPMTEICSEVAPEGNEPLVVKAEATGFGAASPEAVLRAQNVEWLVVAGVWSEACVDATVKDAVKLGFRVLLVKDACGSGTQAMHQTAILNLANRLYGGAVASTEAACRLMRGEEAEVWQVEGAVPIRFTFEDAAAHYAAL